MAINPTQPRTSQVLFRSPYTGDHTLDTYLTEAQIAGKDLGELLGQVFSATDGTPIILNWRGEWASGAQYYKSDVVENGAAWYVCTADHIAGASVGPQFRKFADFTSAFNTVSNAEAAAEAHASNALAYANNAAASLDDFDDRYLGSKSVDPVLDNDGNALLEGALYWNTATKQMKVWDGTAWATAYLPAAGYLPVSGGTMTGTVTFAGGQAFPGVLPLSGGTVTGDTSFNTVNIGGAMGLAGANYGTAGQVPVSQGEGLPPVWGDAGGDPAAAILVVSSTNLEAGNAYRITAASAVTLTLPATPSAGDAIHIMDGESISSVVNHTVARNGNTIMGNAEDLTLNVSGIDFTIWFNGSDWRLF